MTRPSYKKQREIERLLIFEVFQEEDTPRSWSDLWSKAKQKGLTSPSTLSEYLKRLERARYVTRSIDTRTRPPKPIYRLAVGARSRWEIERVSRVPVALHLGRSETQGAPSGEHRDVRGEVFRLFPSSFDAPDEDRVLDSGKLSILAGGPAKDQVLFIYCDNETRQLWDKIVPQASEAHLFFVMLHAILLRGLAKRRMLALGKRPRPHISNSSTSEQTAWLKKAFDFDVTISLRLNGREAFDWDKLLAAIEELKTDSRCEHLRATNTS